MQFTTIVHKQCWGDTESASVLWVLRMDDERWMKQESEVDYLYSQSMKEGLGLGIHREAQAFYLEVNDIWTDKV